MVYLKIIKDFLDQNFKMQIPDLAINGIQVSTNKKIRKIVTGVDFSLAMLKESEKAQTDLILVHHGLFWGKPFPIANRHYPLIAGLIKHDIGLIAIHLPLDIHPKMGNNFLLLKKLKLKFNFFFGNYHGEKILIRGNYLNSKSIKEFEKIITDKIGNPISIIASKQRVQKVGICTGGGHFGIEEARENNCDTFITGDAKHTSFHLAMELDINLIQAGHYNTETLGIKKLGEVLAKKFNLKHQFIDLPTNL